MRRYIRRDDLCTSPHQLQKSPFLDCQQEFPVNSALPQLRYHLSYFLDLFRYSNACAAQHLISLDSRIATYVLLRPCQTPGTLAKFRLRKYLGRSTISTLFEKKTQRFCSRLAKTLYSKLMWSKLYSFGIGGCSSRKNVITQSRWTNTSTSILACNIDSELIFIKNTDGQLCKRKIFFQSFQSFYASQTISEICHPAATSTRKADIVEFISQSSNFIFLVN